MALEDRNMVDITQRDDPIWETITIVIDKTQPNQGFGIAISGGVDNPHFKTGSTAIIVSDIVPGSPSDGLLSVHDEILFINDNNMNRATHDDAVQALREAGMQARMVIRRLQPDSSYESSVPENVTCNAHDEASIIWRSKLVLADRRAPTVAEQQLPREVKYNVHNEARTLWDSNTLLDERSASTDTEQQLPQEVKYNVHSEAHTLGDSNSVLDGRSASTDTEQQLPQEVKYNVHNEARYLWDSSTVLDEKSASTDAMQQLPRDVKCNVYNEERTLWNSKNLHDERRVPSAAEQQFQKPEIKMELNGFDEVLALNAGDNKTRVTLQRDFGGNGFTMGGLFYVREVAHNRPILRFGDSCQGERVLEMLQHSAVYARNSNMATML